jgi:hypothetical protein
MDYGIRQRLTQRRLNLQFCVRFISALRNQAHVLIYEWRDESDLTHERLPQLDTRISSKSLRAKKKEPVCGSSFRTPIGVNVHVKLQRTAAVIDQLIQAVDQSPAAVSRAMRGMAKQG